MTQKIVNPDDLGFLLYELFDVERLTRFPRYEEHSRETFDAAIELALKVAAEEFAPHNRLGDTEEPQFVDGRVVMRPEVKRALSVYAERRG
jgi:hypothetical protein